MLKDLKIIDQMAGYRRFEDLPIWQRARVFSKKVFEATLGDKFSKEFRLCAQIRASSGSIMDNIAEGFERNGNGEFKQMNRKIFQNH